MSVEPICNTRVVTAQDQDGSQVLIWEWSDGSIEVSRREGPHQRWGPPLQIIEDKRDS